MFVSSFCWGLRVSQVDSFCQCPAVRNFRKETWGRKRAEGVSYGSGLLTCSITAAPFNRDNQPLVLPRALPKHSTWLFTRRSFEIATLERPGRVFIVKTTTTQHQQQRYSVLHTTARADRCAWCGCSPTLACRRRRGSGTSTSGTRSSASPRRKACGRTGEGPRPPVRKKGDERSVLLE